MKQRILVAVIGIPLLLFVLCWLPHWATAALLAALGVIGAHELLAAVLPPEKTRRWWGLAAALSVFVVADVYFRGEPFAGTPIQGLMPWLTAAQAVVVFICMVLEYGKKEEMDFTALCAILMAGVAIPMALTCLLRLRMLEHGAGLVLIPLVAAFMSDTMALFGGMLFGKTKLAPRVSPKKTREGAVSGLVGGDGMKMRQYCFRDEAMSGGYISEVITEALSMAESNACMCRIVAAPTAALTAIFPAKVVPMDIPKVRPAMPPSTAPRATAPSTSLPDSPDRRAMPPFIAAPTTAPTITRPMTWPSRGPSFPALCRPGDR